MRASARQIQFQIRDSRPNPKSQAPKDPASQPEQPALPAAVTMETPNAYCVLEALQHNPVTGQSQVSKDYLVPPLRTVDQLACAGAERS